MLTSTEPCDELRPMVTERFFIRYSNSRPSSRATAAAAAAAAAILASEGGSEAGRPRGSEAALRCAPPPAPAPQPQPPPATGREGAAAPPSSSSSPSPPARPDALRRPLIDGGAGPMGGPHAHGAMAEQPMRSGAEDRAALHVRLAGAGSAGEGGKTRSGAASPERSRQRAAPPRRGRTGPGGEAGPGGARSLCPPGPRAAGCPPRPLPSSPGRGHLREAAGPARSSRSGGRHMPGAGCCGGKQPGPRKAGGGAPSHAAPGKPCAGTPPVSLK